VEAIRRSPFTEKVGRGKAFWLCNNVTVTFRAGDATLFVESGCKVAVSYGNFTVYARNGASVHIGVKARCTVYHEPQAKITQGTTLPQNLYPCPALNYDYAQVRDDGCPKLPPVEIPAEPLPDTTNIPANTIIETPYTEPEQPQNPNNNPDYPNNPTTDTDNHIIPAAVIVVNVQQNLYASQRAYWICPYGSLYLTGNSNVIYIEKGGSIALTGNQNIIYVKTGGRIALGSGSQNEVYYQDDSSLTANQSKRTKFTKLFQMDFDISRVNSRGCR
jgi:hypothetical protein